MRTATFLTCAGFLLMAGCSKTASTTSANTMTDSDVEQAIHARFDTNAELRAANLDVDADVKDNTVKLSGTVPTEGLRTQAVQIAKDVQPAAQITDKIDVKPRELTRSDYTEQMANDARVRAKTTGDSIGSSIDDAWVHTKITSKLIVDKDTPAHKINVDVNDGVVTLRGQVSSVAAKAEAERIAKETESVKRVRNLLKVTAG